jgi:hypothetical protein
VGCVVIFNGSCSEICNFLQQHIKAQTEFWTGFNLFRNYMFHIWDTESPRAESGYKLDWTGFRSLAEAKDFFL